MRAPTHQRTTARACALLLAFGSTALWASEPVQQSFSMPMGMEFDSNPELLPGDTGSVVRYRWLPQYTYSRISDAAEWSVVLGARLERSNNTQLSDNRQDPSAQFKWQQTSPTASWGVNAGYAKVSTRATEFEQTGLVTSDRTQTNQNLGANWSQMLTERLSAQASISQQSVDYDTAALTSYSNTSVSVGLSHDWSEAEKLSLNLTGSHYSPDAGGLTTTQSSNSTGFMLGYGAILTPEFDWQAQLGVMHFTGTNADTTWQGNLQINHKAERFTSSLSLGRSAATSGQVGGFTTSNALRLQTQYALSERSNAGVQYSQTRNASLTGNRTSTLGANYSLEVTPFWRFEASLQRKTADKPTGQASATVVGINFNYAHPDF